MNPETLHTALQTFTFRGKTIPERMHDGIINYLCHKKPAGCFLMAVFSNSLLTACSKADDENLLLLPVYVAFLYNHAPASSWGAHENVKAWLES